MKNSGTGCDSRWRSRAHFSHSTEQSTRQATFQLRVVVAKRGEKFLMVGGIGRRYAEKPVSGGAAKEGVGGRVGAYRGGNDPVVRASLQHDPTASCNVQLFPIGASGGPALGPPLDKKGTAARRRPSLAQRCRSTLHLSRFRERSGVEPMKPLATVVPDASSIHDFVRAHRLLTASSMRAIFRRRRTPRADCRARAASNESSSKD